MCDVGYLLVSVPCGPEDVRASVSCGTDELTVTWNISVPAEYYTTIISSRIGQNLYCNSTQTRCTKEGLPCGNSYTVTVFSVTGTCFSLPSSQVTVQTCKKLTKIWQKGFVGYLYSFLSFFYFQCHVLPPMSQLCTGVLQILSLCCGLPAVMSNNTLPWPRAAQVTGLSAQPTTLPATFLDYVVERFTASVLQELMTPAQVNRVALIP